MNRCIVRTGVVLLALIIVAPLRAEEPTADQALAQLKAGNVRFVEGKPTARNLVERRTEVAAKQTPFAIVLTCADSRVAPELVFDQGLGDVFVLRVAGNVVDPLELGSIEYAVEHLHTPLVVVMGHEKCGAIKTKLDGSPVNGNLAKLMEYVEIGPPGTGDAEANLAVAIQQNVRGQVKAMTSRSQLIADFAKSQRIKIVPAVYSLTSGKVEWLSDAPRPIGAATAK
ncbi:MAG: carbonic anhydrase [Gemmataceae bacterium]